MPRIPIPNCPYRVSFFSFDLAERRHVHVRRERFECKVWIEPDIEVAWNSGFASHELNAIVRLVTENRNLIQQTYESAKNSWCRNNLVPAKSETGLGDNCVVAIGACANTPLGNRERAAGNGSLWPLTTLGVIRLRLECGRFDGGRQGDAQPRAKGLGEILFKTIWSACCLAVRSHIFPKSLTPKASF